MGYNILGLRNSNIIIFYVKPSERNRINSGNSDKGKGDAANALLNGLDENGIGNDNIVNEDVKEDAETKKKKKKNKKRSKEALQKKSHSIV